MTDVEENNSGSQDAESDDDETAVAAKPSLSKGQRRMEEINRNKNKKAVNNRDGLEAVKTIAASETNPPSSSNEIATMHGCVVASNKEDCWAHDSFPPIEKAVIMEYCPMCGLPPDYCEFGECWESKCKPWVLTHYPHYYPDLAPLCATSPVVTQNEGEHSRSSVSVSGSPVAVEVDKVEADISALSLRNCHNLDVPMPEEGGGDAAEEAPAEGTATKKKSGGGGGKKVSAKPVGVTIQKVSRAKKKTVTVVIGLDTLGVKMDKASKLFSKRFSCGASVIKGGSGLPDQIDIQGDVSDMLTEVITVNFPEVSPDKITYLKSK